ncbi:MAG TPA: DUF3347 domain-containing protein [Flavipsychrobacter sp.]|nr:DUF3347 domain-containing protein [Flavipsychrobacter sp.]
MKKVTLAVVLLLFWGAVLAQDTKQHLDNYIHIKTSLVNSDAKAAASAISIFYDAVKKDGSFAQKTKLLKAAEKLNKAGSSIEKQRAAFDDVSGVMWELVKGSDEVTQPVYYQYCPMKKSYWLSKEKDIKNPYYGSSMLTCGKVAETKK